MITDTVPSMEEGIPSEWTSLDESLRCTLCGDHFHAAVTIADPECGHSFCSECIRNTFSAQMKSTKRERKCPACRCPVVKESMLIPNRSIQETVLAFQKTLKEWKRRQQKQESPLATPSPTSGRPVRAASRREIDSKKHIPEEPGASPSGSMQEPIIMKKKPKPVYANKNRKKLQEMCEKEGLPTKSSDSFQDLKDRHEAFINLWNAESDSIHPRSARELVDEIMNREQHRRKEQLFGSGQADHVALHTLLEHGTSGNASFEQKLNKNFSKLIQDMKEREKANKNTKAKATAEVPGPTLNAPTSSSELPVQVHKTTTPQTDDCNDMASPDTTEPTGDTVDDLVESASTRSPNDTSISSPPTTIEVETEKDSSNDLFSTMRSSSLPERPKRSLPTGRSLRPKRQKSSVLGPWNCERCTFYNETRTWLTAQCEMCNMKRSGF